MQEICGEGTCTSRACSENTLHQRETEIILITPDLGCARYQQRRDCRRICELLDGWNQMSRMRRLLVGCQVQKVGIKLMLAFT